MRYFLNLFLALNFFTSAAQTGHYFLSHYSPGDERIDPTAFDIAQDQKGILYFATRSGILQFDGKGWDLVRAGAVYALEINKKDEIFWAGSRGCGQLVKREDGTMEVQVLSAEGQQDFYDVLAINESIYFLNDDAVYSYSSGEKLSRITSEKEDSFTALFELFGLPHVSSLRDEIFKVEGTKLLPVSLSVSGDVIFSSRYESNYLLGTSDNHLFLCSESQGCREIPLSTTDYFDASVIISGTWVNSDLVAIGTLRGGVVFINPLLGNVEQIINYNTGLPDNETFSITKDHQNNIWVSHDYGFTRIAPSMPLSSFNHYDGLKGNLLCAISFNNEAYVGTTLGLFKLIREEIYEEIVYYEDAPLVMQDKAVQDLGFTPGQTDTPALEEKKKRGFLRFLKRNRGKGQEEEAQDTKLPSSTGDNQQRGLSREKTAISKVRKTARILSASQYAFRKVAGIEAKVTHLTESDGILIASGLSGVFQIDDLKATSILQEPVRYIFAAEGSSLIASTQSDKVFLLGHNNNGWTVTPFLQNQNESVSFGFSNGENEIWLCGLERMYQVIIKAKEIEDVRVLDFPNRDFYRTVGTYHKDQVIFVNAEGFYHFDQDKEIIVKIDSLSAPRTYFAVAGNLWYHDAHAWNVFGNINLSKTHLLNIVKDVRSVIPAESAGMLWIIAGSNELYKVFTESEDVNASPFPLFLKSVTQADKKLPIGRRLGIDQEGGLLMFEVTRPDYSGRQAIEYRYFLRGMHDRWSDWSSNHDRISFLYLPQGNYALQVQSRDIQGNIAEMTPVTFIVRPPYWKTPWFYAMEFAFFSLLVMLSFKLSVKYRIVSRLLLLLTIILLIELVQTIIGYSLSSDSSPVIDFVIQVVVALIILPAEGFLRKYINHSMGSGSRLYEVISDLDRRKKGRK